MYCYKHCIFFSGKKCDKCEDGKSPHLRMREEVADPKEWARYKKFGWTR